MILFNIELEESLLRELIVKESESSYWSLHNSNIGYALKYHKKLQTNIDVIGHSLLTRKLEYKLKDIRKNGIHIKKIKVNGHTVQYDHYIS